MTPKVYVADFVVFGRRTRRTWKKRYSYAYGALRAPTNHEWAKVTDFIIGFASSRE